jgi:hypothetical protein
VTTNIQHLTLPPNATDFVACRHAARESSRLEFFLPGGHRCTHV